MRIRISPEHHSQNGRGILRYAPHKRVRFRAIPSNLQLRAKPRYQRFCHWVAIHSTSSVLTWDKPSIANQLLSRFDYRTVGTN